jgi:hypothetical protein
MTGPAPAASYSAPATMPASVPPRAPTAPTTPVAIARRRARLSLTGDAGTPAVLQTLMVGLIIGSLVWGVVTALTVAQHSSAATEVASTSEPLSLAAQRMYLSLSDADVKATTSFLAHPPGGTPMPLADRQAYDADIANAAAELATLRSAGTGVDSAKLDKDLAAISAGLPVYTGYVQRAETYSSLGFLLTGGSFVENASEEMHLVLLPAANDIYSQENAALTSASAQATGLPLIVVCLLVAIAVGYVLLRSQRWLTRRTHRRLNPGLLLATAALAITTIWMVVAFASARSSFGEGLGHGSTPAESLAQASIAAQAGRRFEVLNLISRSGASSFQADITDAQKRIGPGSGSLLDAAAAASPSGAGAHDAEAAARDAKNWESESVKVFSLDPATATYEDETSLVIGAGSGSSQAAFEKLETDLRNGIAADQVVFKSSAASGSSAFDGLEAAVIIATSAMAAGSAWGVSRRLAEYR